MKFRFINLEGKDVLIDIVRKYPKLEGPTHLKHDRLIEVLQKDNQHEDDENEDYIGVKPQHLRDLLFKQDSPISYQKAAALASEIVSHAKEKAQQTDENRQGPGGMTWLGPDLITYTSPSLATYLQLMVQIGLRSKSFAEEPELRIQNLLTALNLNLASSIDRLLYGYQFSVDSSGLQTNIEEVASKFTYYGMVLTDQSKGYKCYNFKIIAGSPLFGVKTLNIRPEDIFKGIKKDKLELKEIKQSSLDFTLLTQRISKVRDEEKELNKTVENLFSASSLKELTKNNIRIGDLYRTMRITFIKGDNALTKIQEKEVLNILNQLGIVSNKISFEAPCTLPFIESGSRININLQKSDFIKLLEKWNNRFQNTHTASLELV